MTVSTSLIITTYNRADALSAVLRTAIEQSVLPDEVIVADDGSNNQTKEVVTQYQAHYPVPLKYIWRPDDGFRLAECRNRALAVAQGEYIILIDGDMLLSRDFIADHLRVAQKNIFVQGSRVLLSEKKTNELLRDPHFELPRWYQAGVLKRRSTIRLPWIAYRIAHFKTKNLHGIRGCNCSFFRDEALAINGFNNDFVGWGREDSEFVVRFFNNGGQRINLRFAAIAFHLWHSQASRQALPANESRLEQALQLRLTYCPNGISVFLGQNDGESRPAEEGKA